MKTADYLYQKMGLVPIWINEHTHTQTHTQWIGDESKFMQCGMSVANRTESFDCTSGGLI